MRIVFGHNRFKLKTIDPSEIGLFGSEYNDIKFELFQKYGHLYWIPFFPLGKMWAIEKGDKHKYVCHPDIEEKLDQMVGRNSKLSIFAWTGFLLIIAGFTIFSIYQKMENARWERIAAESQKRSIEEKKDRINELTSNNYLLFSIKPNGQSSFQYPSVPLKVLQNDHDKILLGSYVSAATDTVPVSPDGLFVDFIMSNSINDSFWVNKSILKAAIEGSTDEKTPFNGIAINDYYKGGTLKLNEVKTVAGPSITENLDAPGKTETYFELVNNGFDAIADSIVSDLGYECKISKKRSFKNGEIIAIELSQQGYYTLYCSDKQKNVYRYKLNNYGRLHIEQEFD